MDDADLGNNIDEQAQVVDDFEHDKVPHDGAMNDQIYLDPSRWWFASAAFPMIAGTLGPVASAFSICALVRNWRQHILPGSDVTKAVYVNDPPWLLAVNAVQLVIALVANVFLLLNMTKRVRFSIAQPITIVGWYISSICLVALCATATGPLEIQPEIEYVWSQAFYYGMYAAILYFIVASLMVITVWGADNGHYSKDFDLTASQRTLMLQTIVFLVYLLVGALIFSKIEGWNYLDSIYWADVTLFTVGFGDISPQTKLGRGLLVPYALVGVISLGLVIGSIRSMILDRGKHRLDARMLERQRRLLIRRMMKKGNAGVLDPVNGGGSEASSRAQWTEFERRRKEFHLMRKVQRQKLIRGRASKRERWTAMAVSSTTWILLWLVGAKIFQECEAPYQGWSYFDGFYFAFTALTTVGYGDLTPVSNSAKAFFVFWSLLALPTMTVLISNAGDTIVKGVKDGTLVIGNITILPGEHGFRKEMKQVLKKLSCGVLFVDTDIEESPPGFLGAANEHTDHDEDEEDDMGDDEDDGDDEAEDERGRSSDTTEVNNAESHRIADKDAEKGEVEPGKGPTSVPTIRFTDEESTSKPSPSRNKSRSRSMSHSRAPSIARESLPTELPKSRAEYHLVLIDEISRVTKHLRHSPPREYTFKEWAWYLRLIGEDEGNAENHRRPERRPPHQQQQHGGHARSHSHLHPHPRVHPHLHPHVRLRKDASQSSENYNSSSSSDEQGAGSGPGSAAEDRPSKWSWVGHRSPLMDTREEAEWILDKLEQKLREELQALVKAESGQAALGEVKEEERQNEEKAPAPHPIAYMRDNN
ncbi:voltage-gated potassium channel [Annulohypoxylon truncatum]|uniref:voltage-gated potassium channel n=1 Tax=Annulohypoxylon truncatum TaxID=327061 RepID=UPI0020087358|nr:voltage-gated potassium channel [Annulohypoxylon truncatum]KAI1211290.1 voltage-gated potassium channel [Annulohypoxylon truncatum]